MESIQAIIGAEIRRLRKARQLTQTAFGQKIDMHPNLLGRIERGGQNITLLTMARIAAGLEVSIATLVLACPIPRLDVLDDLD